MTTTWRLSPEPRNSDSGRRLWERQAGLPAHETKIPFDVNIRRGGCVPRSLGVEPSWNSEMAGYLHQASKEQLRD
jgi:hypothetical protein